MLRSLQSLPTEGRQAESPVWLLCSFKPGSVYEADFVSARWRVLSTVRALSLRAEHMNSTKDPAVSGAKDERARYQSWEEREHCLRASGHVMKQRVNKEQTDLTDELWFTLPLESAKLVGKVAYT